MLNKIKSKIRSTRRTLVLQKDEMSSLIIVLFILFSVVTLNINGLHDQTKWFTIWNTVLWTAPKIVLLQETHLTIDQEYVARTVPGYQVVAYIRLVPHALWEF